MPQRPQPNRRRGLLRAALAIIVLLVLLLIAMLVVASATAPPATAPAVPLTPPALATPILPPTPAVVLTPKPASGPKTGKRVSTPAKHKAAAGVVTAPRFMELAARDMFRAVHRSAPVRSSRVQWVSPNGRWAASFTVSSGELAHGALRVENRMRGSASIIPDVYSLGRPVWSADSSRIFYLRETSIGGPPGARWSIVQSTPSGGAIIRTRIDALNVTLLGMSHDKLLYLVANTTDTSLYSLGRRGPRLSGIPMSEPITTAYLSPRGSFIAFASPTNCSYCNLNIYDVHRTTLWNGPAGVDNEHAFTWTTSGQLIALLNGRPAVIDPMSETVHTYSRPATLPTQLGDAVIAHVHHGQLDLTDTISRIAVTAREMGG